MKLEFKHLAPYFIHNLKCEILNFKSDYVGEKYGTIKGHYFIDSEPHYMFHNRSVAGKSAKYFKPILRPLSDLGKEIEFKGKKFKPIDKLYKLISVQEMFDFKELITDKANLEFIFKYPYDCIQLMLKLHFDVFGLIDKGLAVDINSL